MIYLYDKDYFCKIKKLRKKLLTIYFILLAVATVIVALLIFLNALEPANSIYTPIYRVSLTVLVAVFTLFSALYLQITYGRVNKYFEKLNHVFYAKKQNSTVTFIRFNRTNFEQNGVSFYTMETLEWSEKKKDFVERNVCVDSEMEINDLKNGDILQIATVANILFAYNRESVNETKSN